MTAAVSVYVGGVASSRARQKSVYVVWPQIGDEMHEVGTVKSLIQDDSAEESPVNTLPLVPVTVHDSAFETSQEIFVVSPGRSIEGATLKRELIVTAGGGKHAPLSHPYGQVLTNELVHVAFLR
ncbi:MAG: hypothetical protein Q7S75_02760 [bacterium]|nr:hypothetical protein [bacterium]